MFSLCFEKKSRFPVFSLTGIFFGHFPCFSCAVGTLGIAFHYKLIKAIAPLAIDRIIDARAN